MSGRPTSPIAAAVMLALAFTLALAATAARADRVSVELVGVEGEVADNVRALLKLAQLAEGDRELTELNIRNLHARAEGEIRVALRPFGYYAPSIDGSLRQDAANDWVARYDITPGEPVRLREVDVRLSGEGASDERLLDVRATLAPARGDVLSHPRYEQLKSRLKETAQERGYRDAVFTEARLIVDPAARSARIDLELDTGIRYRFGELLLDQDVIDESLLRRYATWEAGDYYSTSALIDFEYRLFDSGYFSTVTLNPLEPEGGEVPVQLVADAGPRRAWRLRGGYGTDTGPRVGVGFESRRLNHRGHKLRTNGELSAPRRELTAEYLQPLRRPASDQRSWRVGILDQQLGDTDSLRYSTGVRETRRDGPWQRIRYLRFSTERNITADEESSARLLVPGYTLVRASSNDVTYPTRGSYLQADLHGGLRSVLSDTSFVQLRTDGRLIRPMGKRDRLLLRGELGVIAAGDFGQLPASERFFAGGDRSVRGFALNDLGPRDDNDQVVGGRYLLVGSVEYEHRLVGNWGVGFFVDAGNAFDEPSLDVEASVGAGLRWLSPIGMVRMDLARPVTSGGDGIRLHFTFGPEL